MGPFGRFAKRILHYRALLVIAAAGAIFDALCAFGGFASLMWLIDQLFNRDVTTYQLLEKALADERVRAWVGSGDWLLALVPRDKFAGFAFMLGIVLTLAILGSIGRFTHQYAGITVSLRTVMRIRKEAFQRMVHMPLAVVSTEGISDKLSRIVRDCAQLGRGFNALLSKAVRDVLQGGVCLAVALVVDWRLTAIFLLGLPVIGVLLWRFGRIMRKASRRALGEYGRMLGAIQESIGALRVVKVHQGEGYERRRFNTINRRVLQQEMRARTVRALSSPVVELMALAGVMAVALLAAWYVFRPDGAEPADLIKVLLMLGAGGASLRPLANLNNDLQEAMAAAERIDELIHVEVEPNTRRHPGLAARQLPRHGRSVRFENVWYTYPEAARPAIQGVSLEVDHGMVCAIVGGNGAGKSTLLGLLPRLYEPQRGRLCIDEIDIATCSLRSVRRQMAMVSQQTVLFEGTIEENLTYGCRHTQSEAVIEAARRACAHKFIAELPDGYQTELGEWGMRLSGGQRQRLALARAMLRDPSILILDEATSQVDSESEAQIVQAMTQFMQERTTFVIAHRLSTVVNADLIVVMADGCIAAMGRHDELLRTSDIYRVLCHTQLHGSAVSQAGGVTSGNA
jgi:ABC-type multidrug transport system fused ATPase/permease subunit